MKHLKTVILLCKCSDKLMIILLVFTTGGCVEPFDAESLTFESALVIDATITNELKRQQVLFSRSFVLEEEGPAPERNATVYITDDQGTEFRFTEISAGNYLSEKPFAASAGREYRLRIKTGNGHSYASEVTRLTPLAQIESVFAERITNDEGIEGVAIRVNASGVSGDAKNYRYTFEETYKIIAPEWTPQDLRGAPEGGCGVIVVLREEEEQTCYAMDSSRSIILTDTNSFSEDRVNSFMVRFINRDNYLISHRYSILIRQMVQSDVAYIFFETLNKFSGSESLFSETQPGFLEGNVFSEETEGERVLGYFDVASVTEQRIFFNYNDLFPGEPLPPYADPCNYNAPRLAGPGGCILRPIVEANLVRYVGDNVPGPFSPGEGRYITVPRICGDCTVLGGVEVPEFWTE